MSFDPTEWLALANSVAGDYARKYPAVEREDVFAELSLKLVEDGARVYAGADNAPALLKTWLQEKASDYCKTARAQALAYTTQYTYRPDDVRRIVQTWVDDREHWEGASIVPTDARSIDPVMQSTDAVDILSDVSRAFYGQYLTDDTRRTLIIGATYGQDWQAVAEDHGGEPKSLSKAYGRAIDKLTLALNAGR